MEDYDNSNIRLDWNNIYFVRKLHDFIQKAFRPKVRLFGLSFFLIGNIILIPFAILLGIEGLLTAQILLMIMNVRGIIILKKKMKITIN